MASHLFELKLNDGRIRIAPTVILGLYGSAWHHNLLEECAHQNPVGLL